MALCCTLNQEERHADSARKMAEHWEAEAQRQAAKFEAANVSRLEKEVQRMQQQLAQTESKLLEAEAQVWPPNVRICMA